MKKIEIPVKKIKKLISKFILKKKWIKVIMKEIIVKPKKIFKKKFFLMSNLTRHP